MPVTIPPADLHATTSHSTHYQGHQRLRDEEDPVELAPHLTNTGYAGDKLEAEGDVGKYGAAGSQDEDAYSGKVEEEGQAYPTSQSAGIKGKGQRLMQVLVKHGVEARATEPVPEEVSRVQHKLFQCSSVLLFSRNEPSSSGGRSSRNSPCGPPRTPTFSVSQQASWVPTCSASISTRASG